MSPRPSKEDGELTHKRAKVQHQNIHQPRDLDIMNLELDRGLVDRREQANDPSNTLSHYGPRKGLPSRPGQLNDHWFEPKHLITFMSTIMT